jgi:hypothetical protein
MRTQALQLFVILGGYLPIALRWPRYAIVEMRMQSQTRHRQLYDV